MLDRSVLRWGGAAAMAGAVLGFVFNVLHPRPTLGGDAAQAELELIANSGIWLFDHFMLAWSLAFAFIGLVAIGWSFREGRAASWARIATASAIGSIAIAFLTVTIDGMANKEIADGWAASPGDAALTAAGEAMMNLSLALFTATIGSLFGLTPVLFGIASLATDQYPRWLGVLALAAGLLGLLTASLQYLTGPSVIVTAVMFTIASLAFTVWSFLMGWRLWQGETGPAPAETARTAVAA